MSSHPCAPDMTAHSAKTSMSSRLWSVRLMRAEWDIARYLRSGRLVQVLRPYHTPDADIYAVYPPRHQLAARVRTFVDFLAVSLAQQSPGKLAPG
ncbi:hypothetical protein Veis_4298 [Verminephrobacter eiseniae EF01-2]|uniref:LysR substrate-binding domain-containing protein n=1 Tax=Verminephrobacter eiseniae (strain EF01-2) TaxID=391735 RepID=A1WQU5_VEREI|nr:hypothetical protein Veis_4298 [Verminephrobacter eiseniae EF01-2]